MSNVIYLADYHQNTAYERAAERFIKAHCDFLMDELTHARTLRDVERIASSADKLEAFYNGGVE